MKATFIHEEFFKVHIGDSDPFDIVIRYKTTKMIFASEKEQMRWQIRGVRGNVLPDETREWILEGDKRVKARLKRINKQGHG